MNSTLVYTEKQSDSYMARYWTNSSKTNYSR